MIGFKRSIKFKFLRMLKGVLPMRYIPVSLNLHSFFTIAISNKSGLKSGELMYRSNRSFNMPPSGIPRAFDTFAVPGRREFDYQSLPGGGEFDPHALGVGNLNCTLDFM